LQPQCYFVLPRTVATAFSHSCLWVSLQNAQHVHQLEADLQDAQQATEQAEFERDGAVADTDSAIEEGVHLAQQRDKFENLVQDLVEENEAFKAEAQVSQLSERECVCVCARFVRACVRACVRVLPCCLDTLCLPPSNHYCSLKMTEGFSLPPQSPRGRDAIYIYIYGMTALI